VSLDGSRLYYSSNRTGVQNLWTLPAQGGAQQQLTNDPTPNWWPAVSPDGREVAFYSYRSGRRDIWVMPATGGAARQVTDDEASD
jgi:Tol biopolymer transport system component